MGVCEKHWPPNFPTIRMKVHDFSLNPPSTWSVPDAESRGSIADGEVNVDPDRIPLGEFCQQLGLPLTVKEDSIALFVEWNDGRLPLFVFLPWSPCSPISEGYPPLPISVDYSWHLYSYCLSWSHVRWPLQNQHTFCPYPHWLRLAQFPRAGAWNKFYSVYARLSIDIDLGWQDGNRRVFFNLPFILFYFRCIFMFLVRKKMIKKWKRKWARVPKK